MLNIYYYINKCVEKREEAILPFNIELYKQYTESNTLIFHELFLVLFFKLFPLSYF